MPETNTLAYFVAVSVKIKMGFLASWGGFELRGFKTMSLGPML